MKLFPFLPQSRVVYSKGLNCDRIINHAKISTKFRPNFDRNAIEFQLSKSLFHGKSANCDPLFLIIHELFALFVINRWLVFVNVNMDITREENETFRIFYRLQTCNYTARQGEAAEVTVQITLLQTYD